MARVLVSVITGGRPALKDRPTARWFPTLQANGFTDIEWVIREDHAEAYERDDQPVNVYPLAWANEYSRSHWRHPTFPFTPGGFHGAFAGREWACRSAEQRGFDAILQLDDNVDALGLIESKTPAYQRVLNPGRMLHLLVELTLASNAWMCSPRLDSIVPPARPKILRPGYPYSVYVERTCPGRMPYYGPFEDDIMHAIEYATNGGPMRTAAVCEAFTYHKRPRTTDGMRAHYQSDRGLELIKRYPGNAKLSVARATSSPRDKTKGVRHFLNTRGFAPIRVTDPARFSTAEAEVRDRMAAAIQSKREWDRDKIRHRSLAREPR